MIPTKIARLAGLGAYAASAAFIALFLLISYASRHTATGGMLSGLSWVTWISLGVVFAALIAAHVYLGKQLIALAKGESQPI